MDFRIDAAMASSNGDASVKRFLDDA